MTVVMRSKDVTAMINEQLATYGWVVEELSPGYWGAKLESNVVGTFPSRSKAVFWLIQNKYAKVTDEWMVNCDGDLEE